MNLSQDPHYTIRYFEEEDGPELKQWMLEPSINQFNPVSNEQEAEDAVKLWTAFARFKCGLTAIHHGKKVAVGMLLLMPYRKVTHHCLLYLYVDPAHTKKGYGTSLLNNLIHLGKEYFRIERVHVEVYGENPIQSMLRKEGFVLIAQQEKFLKDAQGFHSRFIWEKKCR